MKNRWLALTALTILSAACARGGEGDAGAALNDTTSSAPLTGDTAVGATVTGMEMADSAAMGHDGHMMDSTAQGAATTGDSAAHP